MLLNVPRHCGENLKRRREIAGGVSGREQGRSVIGLIILCAIGYGIYAFFDNKPSPSTKEQRQQKQAQEIPQLKTQIAELEKKPEHQYELRNVALRTWRFDPATGDSCIQLTTEADWKKAETIRQSCEYQDIRDGSLIRCLMVKNRPACNQLQNTSK